jgi:hypothetical protein
MTLKVWLKRWPQKHLNKIKPLIKKRGDLKNKIKWDLMRGREPQPNQLKLSLCHPYDVVILKLRRDNEKKV